MEKNEILSRRLKRAQIRDQSRQFPKNHKPTHSTQNVLSFSQERFWFLNQLDPNDATHSRPFAWRVSGDLNKTIFDKTVSAIVQRHEILRTTITIVGNQPMATVHPNIQMDSKIHDLSQNQNVLLSTLEKLIKTPTSFDQAPLLRAHLLKISEQEHVAFFMMHHMVFDALSEEVFKREFQTLYGSYLNRSSLYFPALPVQFSDVAQWEKERLTADRLSQLETFWHEQLDQAPTFLPLPTDYNRPAENSKRGGQVLIEFPADLVEKLTRFSHKQNTTLFTTLLTTFYLLLCRTTYQTDILIGTPTVGRLHPEAQNLIGFFTNTLVLRGDLAGDPTFASLLQTIRKMILSSFDHQDYPVEKLFESIKFNREANVPDLFQVVFNLENVTSTIEIPNGPRLEPLDLGATSAIYDLAVELQDDGQRLSGAFIYNADLFKPETIKRMTVHYLTLMRAILDQPGHKLSQIPILTCSEKSKILNVWNQTDVAYDQHLRVHEVFEQQAAINPNKIALKSGQQTITYKRLNERSNQLARHLVARGVGPDQLVGLFLERSIDMIVGLIAILKAGGGYVPIDPQLPRERVEFMLNDSHAEVVLTEMVWRHHLPESIKYPIWVDRLPESVSHENKQNLELKPPASSLAYMIYTSGSTGTPKGVMITHRNLVNYVHGRAHAGIYNKNDTMLHGSTLSFDIAVEEIFCPLLLGGRIVLLNRIGFKDIDLILETIQEEKVTAFSTTPSVLTQCLAAPKLAGCFSLAKVILGGEALSIDLKNQWLEQTGIPLINSYGPTETTVDVTTYRCTPETPYPTIPIGRPSANTKVYILDQHLQPAPIGVAGEIMIGGDTVGRGYWNRPELTAEKFVPNPHGTGRIYRTGDLGRFLADGNIEFLGRIDHQTKIRGFRVELREIEAAILEHDYISQTVVLAPEINGSKQLVAYVATLKSSEKGCFSGAELKNHLSIKLPDYMIPPYIVMLEKLPLMLNGKVNLQGLPHPSAKHLATAKRFIPPYSAAEKQLAAIWSDSLKINQIGTQDNFFDLGGHSLLVTKVIARIRSSMGIEFPMKTFFETPKLADQAEILELMLET